MKENNEEKLKIIKHFGIKNQLKKINEEAYELIEAVNEYENALENKTEKLIGHIAEEIADLSLLIEQIKSVYNISNEKITKIINEKITRTLLRIENGYYNTKNK